MDKNKSVCDYKSQIEQLDKIHNLCENKIYDEQEYKNKKEMWIEGLKSFVFDDIEMDFLNEILPSVKNNTIDEEELKNIKYIISGEYAEDEYRKKQEYRLRLEEEKKRKRKETIENVKT
ncbi:hypothetical protein FDF31_07935 [Clostridium sporogenes]|uniref:hypothetical protein n=1 Tax=Clostridium sp. LCP25S3_F8 TaxID=3438751 RepID=UPI0013D02361|nr:hypothetical protein [Clostridium sporogenes]NFS25565.1 hypothetical protein [Clostridium sporogenes]